MSNYFNNCWKGLLALFQVTPLYRDDNADSQPLEALSDQVWIKYQLIIIILNIYYSHCGFSTKVTCAFLQQEHV